jgi:phosphohistidine phosphatase SixA
MRHAPREVPTDVAEMEDGDPAAELTPEGALIATAMGEWLAEKGEIPSVIYASDAVRTQMTAESVAKAIEDAGFVAPKVKTDVGIGSHKSIRALILKVGANGEKKVMLVSHKETIMMGLKALEVDNNDNKAEKPDPHAAGEIRIYDVKRKNGNWSEDKRVRPSDIGFDDVY